MKKRDGTSSIEYLGITAPTPHEIIRQGTGLLRVDGVIRAAAGWFDAQGLARWTEPRDAELKRDKVSPHRFELLPLRDSRTVECPAIRIAVNGRRVTA